MQVEAAPAAAAAAAAKASPPAAAKASELSKEEGKLLEERPTAPKTVISADAVRKPSKEAPARRAASQEEPIAA